MSVQLLPFQRVVVAAVPQDWAAGFRALLVSLPTGAGKAQVGSALAYQHITGRPTPRQQAALRRAWATRGDDVGRILGDCRQITQRGEASGVICTLHVLWTIREGTPERRAWAIAHVGARYGGERNAPRLFVVAGPLDSPLVAALRRTDVDLRQTRHDSFRHLLRQTLECCTLHVYGSRLTVIGSTWRAAYTTTQWMAIREVLTRELGRVGELEVVIVPDTHPRISRAQEEGGHYARSGS